MTVDLCLRTTIDAAGRIVLPKAVRDKLGLGAGAELEVTVVDRRIELDVPDTPRRLEEHEHAVVAVADREMPGLTTDAVRDTLERLRR